AGGVEKLEHRAFVIRVAEGCKLIVDAVHIIFNVVVSNIEAVRLAVWIEHAKVAVKAPVLLQHKNNVIHCGNATRRGSGGSRSGCWGRRWRSWSWGRCRRRRCRNSYALR